MKDSRQKTTEIRNRPTYTHSSAAVQHGKEDHLTGHERTRQELEHTKQAFEHAQQSQQNPRVEPQAAESAIAARAYELWQARGCPLGSPERDWFQAAEELRSRN